MIFYFDLDNVICKTEGSDYSTSTPYNDVIKKVNTLYNEGNDILIFTARFMGRNKEDIELAKKEGFNFTCQQLEKWGVRYTRLIFGKPVYDIYIDDKNFEFKSNWLDEFKKKF